MMVLRGKMVQTAYKAFRVFKEFLPMLEDFLLPAMEHKD
jgi:hypothetical protein